jgi:guanylate kinase
MGRGRLIVVSGPSGVGKSTLLRDLFAAVPGLAFSVSHTTRAPRAKEVHGEHYHFVDEEQFRRLVSEDRFLEWAEVHGRLYGTARESVEVHQAQGLDVVLDVDVQGARSVKQAAPDALFVMVAPPSWQALKQRLGGRGTESAEQLQRRLSVAREELRCYHLYDYVVINGDLEAACDALRAIVTAGRHSLQAQRPLLEGLLEQADERP